VVPTARRVSKPLLAYCTSSAEPLPGGQLPQVPAVTRSYAVSVPVGVRVDKRIPYANERQAPRLHRAFLTPTPGGAAGSEGRRGWGRGRRQRYRQSASCRGRRFCSCIRSRNTAAHRRIGPLMGVGSAEALLFVSNEAGQAEEALLLQITVG